MPFCLARLTGWRIFYRDRTRNREMDMNGMGKWQWWNVLEASSWEPLAEGYRPMLASSSLANKGALGLRHGPCCRTIPRTSGAEEDFETSVPTRQYAPSRLYFPAKTNSGVSKPSTRWLVTVRSRFVLLWIVNIWWFQLVNQYNLWFLMVTCSEDSIYVVNQARRYCKPSTCVVRIDKVKASRTASASVNYHLIWRVNQ